MCVYLLIEKQQGGVKASSIHTAVFLLMHRFGLTTCLNIPSIGIARTSTENNTIYLVLHTQLSAVVEKSDKYKLQTTANKFTKVVFQIQ